MAIDDVVRATDKLTRWGRLRTQRQHRARWFYLLVTPWLLGFLLLQVLPVLGTMLIALLDWELSGGPQLIGLGNFTRMFSDPILTRALVNTIVFALVTVPVGLILGLVLAVLLHRRLAAVRLFRTVFLLPTVVPAVVIALTWSWLLNPRFGLANRFLALLNISGPAWLFDPNWALPVVMVMHLWTAGINMVVYLAVLQNLPNELYDAARIDGANSWQRFRHLTSPLLAPITLYLTIVNLIGTFQVFTPIYVLTRGGPDNATLTLPIYIYLNAFQWGDFGYASAIATALLFMVMIATLLILRQSGRAAIYQG